MPHTPADNPADEIYSTVNPMNFAAENQGSGLVLSAHFSRLMKILSRQSLSLLGNYRRGKLAGLKGRPGMALLGELLKSTTEWLCFSP
jgi:hypothetical protein